MGPRIELFLKNELLYENQKECDDKYLEYLLYINRIFFVTRVNGTT